MSILVGAFLFASLAAADTTPAAAVEEKNDPIVCKSSKIPVVGTRMKSPPVCMRKSAWNLERQMTQRELQQINERGNNPGKAEGR